MEIGNIVACGAKGNICRIHTIKREEAIVVNLETSEMVSCPIGLVFETSDAFLEYHKGRAKEDRAKIASKLNAAEALAPRIKDELAGYNKNKEKKNEQANDVESNW